MGDAVLLLLSAGGSLAMGAGITWAVVEWRLAVAEDAERRAVAIRDEAARIEAHAAALEATARALYTDTSELPVVVPVSVRVRAGLMLTEVREWAAGLGPDRSPDWQPGELAALTRPPLRTKSGTPARQRRWILPGQPETPATPSPVLLARLPFDPTRRFRVEVRHP